MNQLEGLDALWTEHDLEPQIKCWDLRPGTPELTSGCTVRAGEDRKCQDQSRKNDRRMNSAPIVLVTGRPRSPCTSLFKCMGDNSCATFGGRPVSLSRPLEVIWH